LELAEVSTFGNVDSTPECGFLHGGDSFSVLFKNPGDPSFVYIPATSSSPEIEILAL